MTASEYITAICANIRAGKMKRAKQAFDLAWDMYKKGETNYREEIQLSILRNNFYPKPEPYVMPFTDQGCYYEERILAQCEEDI